ncbi:hypothetical protein GTZ99_14860 [Novosphingobium sp. FSY-8]|uniref:Lipoprotein n=2 Tax=Novosphingobium ovatum TaxID=1908523 RepID=A0ABW9XH05_9SPHN|nr:hypothetical protein [Novosphingobium ovatum]
MRIGQKAVVAGMAVALCAVLAACGAKKDARQDDQRSASGQVLSGSISDAMLPYEATSSQPPLAPRVVHSGAAAAESAADDGATGDAAPASAADDTTAKPSIKID